MTVAREAPAAGEAPAAREAPVDPGAPVDSGAPAAPEVSVDPTDGLAQLLLGWYAQHRRDLPWRVPGIGTWPVLVSEVMLQQTPVARVLPVYLRWLDRWPTPGALAVEAPGEAVRAWDRLGYPRRALRLHAAAVAVVDRHGGVVPTDHDTLIALPGLGAYTAAAVAAFAAGGRYAVLDTNVRRVLGRLLDGQAQPPAAVAVAERARAEALLPADGTTAATWSVALMELGALVCTARAPRCDGCPVAGRCRWLAAGRPDNGGRRRAQPWVGTDRQVRGLLVGVLRGASGPVLPVELAAVWADAAQRDRALTSLVVDGLAVATDDGRYRLP